MTIDPRSNPIDAGLRRSAAKYPDRCALSFSGRRWTYRELDDAVNRAAAYLAQLGLLPGDRVAAYGRNSDAYVIAFLGCMRAGMVHVPVNYSLTEDELAYLLRQSGSRAVLADSVLIRELDKCAEVAHLDHVVALRDSPGSLLDVVATGPVSRIESAASDTDLAQLLYTSGTTGKPKGAMMTHRALWHEYVSCIVALRTAPSDNPLVCMPLYHSAGMHAFLMPYLTVGATVTLLEKPDVPEILRSIEADQIGSLFLAPTVWVAVSNHPDLNTRDLSSLRKAQYGASIMPVTVLSRLRSRFPLLEFYNCFGQTETGPLTTVLPPESHDDHPESCGRPVLFVETRVVDSNGIDVAPGTPGEILYRSPQLCQGYWDKPEETAEAFDDGWFRSGDLVTCDEDNFITVVDRIKDIINTGGVLVAARDVEDALYTHPAVGEVAVVGIPDEVWIEAVTAYVVVKSAVSAVTDTDLIEHVRARLAPFKVPKAVFFVEALPRNQSGKILKRDLRSRSDRIVGASKVLAEHGSYRAEIS